MRKAASAADSGSVPATAVARIEPPATRRSNGGGVARAESGASPIPVCTYRSINTGSRRISTAPLRAQPGRDGCQHWQHLGGDISDVE